MSLFAPTMIVLVLLDVIGCSSFPEPIEPDQKIQRSLDGYKEAVHLNEEQKDWVNYAQAQNNLGMTYQLLAQRGVEPEKNLRLAGQDFKEAGSGSN